MPHAVGRGRVGLGYRRQQPSLSRGSHVWTEGKDRGGGEERWRGGCGGMVWFNSYTPGAPPTSWAAIVATRRWWHLDRRRALRAVLDLGRGECVSGRAVLYSICS
jgi:hypothetical protein